jgi:hypothetical protein
MPEIILHRDRATQPNVACFSDERTTPGSSALGELWSILDPGPKRFLRSRVFDRSRALVSKTRECERLSDI